ncbi:MAG: Nif3-like dinuclear metal center hexameric protein [Pirellulaceae bacterium]
MTTVGDISRWMNNIAPLALSESWDNTGLLLGDPAQVVTKLMTCLTLTPESVSEAVAEQASLVIAHHPLPFKPLSRITTDSLAGKLLWKLASAGIAVYSPHTAWDSADEGINALLANYLQLQNVQPLVPCEVPEFIGKISGRDGSGTCQNHVR